MFNFPNTTLYNLVKINKMCLKDVLTYTKSYCMALNPFFRFWFFFFKLSKIIFILNLLMGNYFVALWVIPHHHQYWILVGGIPVIPQFP